MKIIISVAIAALLVMQTLLPSCDYLPADLRAKIPGQSAATPGPGQTPVPARQTAPPFTFDYKRTEATVDFFTSNDNFETLFAAGPFYEGAQPLPGQGTASFDQARSRKIAEIIKEADTLAQTAGRLEPQMAKVRSAYLSYLSIMQKEEPKLNRFVAETFDQVAALATQEQVAEARYKSIGGSGSNRSLDGSFLNYAKVQNALELGALYLQDAGNILTYSSIALKAAENHPKDAVKRANTQLDKDMQSLDGIRNDLAAALTSIKKIDYGMKQLYTAGWQFSKSANAFMALSLPDIKAKVASLTPQEALTSGQIEAIRAYLALIERWQAGMKRYTDAADKARIVFVEPAQEQRWAFLPRRAMAAGLADEMVDNYNAGVTTLTVPLKAPDPPVAPAPGTGEPGYLETGWNGVKKVVHGVQTGIGVTVDTAGALVQGTARTAVQLYEGDRLKQTWWDVWQDNKKAFKEIRDNYNNSTSGSKTMKTAKEYFDYAETWAGEQVRDILTPGDTSSDLKLIPAFAGYHLTRITTGIFTGFGKGVVLVADRQADAGQYAEGGLEILFTFIGGSKVIVKGSQVKNMIKPTASGLELTWNTVDNFIEAVMSEKLRRQITKESAELLSKKLLTKEAAAKLINNSISLEFREKLLKSLANSRAQMINELKQIMATGGKALLNNMRGEGASSLESMLLTKFDKSLKGVLESIAKAVGDNPTEYLDNIIGEVVDDLIKEWVHTNVDEIAKAAPTPSPTATAKPAPTPTAKPTTPAVNHLAQLQRTTNFKLLVQGKHAYQQDGKTVYNNGIFIPANIDLKNLPITWSGTSFSFSQTRPRFSTESAYSEVLKGVVSNDGNMLVSLDYTVSVATSEKNAVQRYDLSIKLKNVPLRYDYVRKGELHQQEAQACVVSISEKRTASGEWVSSGIIPASRTYVSSDWKDANAGIFLDFN